MFCFEIGAGMRIWFWHLMYLSINPVYASERGGRMGELFLRTQEQKARNQMTNAGTPKAVLPKRNIFLHAHSYEYFI
jgi:hypothetical protein